MAKSYAIDAIFRIIDGASAPMKKIQSLSDVVSNKFMASTAAANKRLQAIGSGIKTVGKLAVGAAVAGTAALITKAIPEAKELEQNIGGVAAVFGELADQIENKANKAFANMGLSASDYMATANKMGSLFQGSGLSQARAMELSTKAMQRAADVASVMGIETSMAMESIAGAAKGNFTMMDNLGVAMNATTLQAYALEKGVNFTWNTASNAEKAELAMQMFFERTEQYAGNFARESRETFSGAFGAMSAAFKNVLGNMALGRDIKPALASLGETIGSFAKNLVPMVVNTVKAIPDFFKAMVPEIKKAWNDAADEIGGPVGGLMSKISKLLDTIWSLRKPIVVISGLVLAWKTGMTAFVAVMGVAKGAMAAWNTVVGIAKGVQLAHAAAVTGSSVAIAGQGTSVVAAKVGMALYTAATTAATGVTTAFSTAAGFLNSVFVASPIGLIVTTITALVGVTAACVTHWEEWGSLVINLLGPIGSLISMIKAIADSWDLVTAAFQNNGILAGLRSISGALVRGILEPLIALFDWLSGLPWVGEYIGNAADKMREWQANATAWQEAAAAPAATSEVAPISLAERAIYNSERIINESNMTISLDKGLTGTVSGKAPGFSVNAFRSGAWENIQIQK